MPGMMDTVLNLGLNDGVAAGLAARTGEALPALASRLLELELEGRVARLPGGLFQRLGSA